MKSQLQRISYVVALIVALTACDKNNDTYTSSTNPTPPPPPPPPPDSVTITQCNDSNRAKISAQLVPVGKLSIGRTGMAVAAAGNKILFACGEMSDGFTTPRVDIYDVATNTWSRTEISKPRTGMATVAAGNKVFFAGGRIWIRNPQSFKNYDSVDIYNTETHAWTEEKLSEPRSNMAAATVGDKVLFAGGSGDDYKPLPTKVDVYDLSTGFWHTARLRLARYFAAAVTMNNKVYFAGGYLLSIFFDPGPSRFIDIYDNATNTWTTGMLKEPMGAITGVAVGDHIYWAAGCAAEIEDVSTGKSKVVPLSKPGAWIEVAGQHAVVKDNKIVLFRFNGEGQTKTFDIYDIATDTWFIGEVPLNISGASIISVNNTIYLAGGIINGAVTNQVWKVTF